MAPGKVYKKCPFLHGSTMVKLASSFTGGPYSVIGYCKGGRGYSEHVPKMIYREPEHYYPYMKERWGANPPEFGYKGISFLNLRLKNGIRRDGQSFSNRSVRVMWC